MTIAMDDLAKKFEGFEALMTQALDKLSGLEAWRTSAEEATGRILTQSERLTARLHRLETAPPHPPPPPPMRPTTAPHPSSSRWTTPSI